MVVRAGVPIRRYGASTASYELPSSPPPISCAFPLDADVTVVGFTQLTMSNGNQTGTMVIPNNANASRAAAGQNFWPLPASAPSLVDLTAGKVGFMLQLDSAPATNASDLYGMALQLYRQSDLVLRSSVTCTGFGGDYYIEAVANGGTVASDNQGPTVPTAIAYAFDADTNEFKWAAKQGGSWTTFTPNTYLPASYVLVMLFQVTPSTGIAPGQTLQATLLSSASDMSDYPFVGYNDLCGNPIGA